MSEEKKVKLVALVAMAGESFSINPGQQIMVGEAEAKRLVAVGHCCDPKDYKQGGGAIDISIVPNPEPPMIVQSVPPTVDPVNPSGSDSDDDEEDALVHPETEGAELKKRGRKPKVKEGDGE